MANDLYGELLARALQRRAPPGHFPAFVTPGEANLLRSYGGGVAPGGGQYMAGGIPAFSYGGEAGFGGGGGEGEPGDPGGFGAGDAFGGMTGEFGGMGFDAFGFSPVDEGDMGRSPADQFASFLAARAKADQTAAQAAQDQAEQEAAAARSAAAQAQAAAQAKAKAAALQTALDIDILDPVEDKTHSVAITRGGLYSPFNIGGWGIHDTFEDDEGFEDTFEENVLSYEDIEGLINAPLGLAEGLEEAEAAYEAQQQEEGLWDEPSIVAALEQGYPSNVVTTPVWSGTLQEAVTQSPLSFSLSPAQNDAAALAAAIEGDTSAVSQVDPSFAAGVEDFTPGGWETPGFEGEQGIGTPTDPGDTSSDSGTDQAMDNIRSADRSIDQAMDLGVSFEDANQSAMDALGGNINEGGMGRFSPANSWGLRSEVALDNIENKRPIGITIADLAALNAQDHQGYAINNPQPTAASIAASQVFAQLNPTITNAVIGLAGFLPGTVGFTAFLAGMIEDKGLMNIPAVRSIPGVSALSDALAGVRTGIGDFFSPITDPIGQALSEGQQAVADALSGIIGTEESAGFDDAGEVDGGAPDIEIVPPITTDTDAAPPPTARTFADVDDETRRRILANIISGLQRTGRPTEGVTAFGPLYGKNFPERSGDGVYEIQPYPRNTFA